MNVHFLVLQFTHGNTHFGLLIFGYVFHDNLRYVVYDLFILYIHPRDPSLIPSGCILFNYCLKISAKRNHARIPWAEVYF